MDAHASVIYGHLGAEGRPKSTVRWNTGMLGAEDVN